MMDTNSIPSLFTPLRPLKAGDPATLTSYSTIMETIYSSKIQDVLNSRISPLNTRSLSSGVINDYLLGSKIGEGQFGKVYKATNKSDRSVVAVKRISKRRPKYSMNQILRRLNILGSYFGIDELQEDSAVTGEWISMLMNVNRSRWELFLLCTLSTGGNGNCPYICQVLECIDSSSSSDLWMVFELCDLGELVWKRNERDGELPQQWISVLGNSTEKTVEAFVEKAAHDLSMGLGYLRKAGCIHRDIKPSNILVDGQLKVLKLSDFGCGLLIPDVLPSGVDIRPDILNDCFRKEEWRIVGSPAFIPPELCQFKANSEDQLEKLEPSNYNPFQMDIWSLGVSLYCIMYGELPFAGDNEFETYQKINEVSLEDKLNGNWSNDLIINHMLVKDPNSRISIESLLDKIKQRVGDKYEIPMEQHPKTTAVCMGVPKKGGRLPQNFEHIKAESSNKSLKAVFKRLFRSKKGASQKKLANNTAVIKRVEGGTDERLRKEPEKPKHLFTLEQLSQSSFHSNISSSSSSSFSLSDSDVSVKVTNFFHLIPAEQTDASPQSLGNSSPNIDHDPGYPSENFREGDSFDNVIPMEKLSEEYLDTPHIRPKEQILDDQEKATDSCSESGIFTTKISVDKERTGSKLKLSTNIMDFSIYMDKAKNSDDDSKP